MLPPQETVKRNCFLWGDFCVKRRIISAAEKVQIAKDFLFANTPKSATGSAVMFSLIQTKSWIRIDT
jgi:hypothetical protein